MSDNQQRNAANYLLKAIAAAVNDDNTPAAEALMALHKVLHARQKPERVHEIKDTVHFLQDMTEIAKTSDTLASGFSGYTFDEDLCRYVIRLQLIVKSSADGQRIIKAIAENGGIDGDCSIHA